MEMGWSRRDTGDAEGEYRPTGISRHTDKVGSRKGAGFRGRVHLQSAVRGLL